MDLREFKAAWRNHLSVKMLLLYQKIAGFSSVEGDYKT